MKRMYPGLLTTALHVLVIIAEEWGGIPRSSYVAITL